MRKEKNGNNKKGDLTNNKSVNRENNLKGGLRFAFLANLIITSEEDQGEKIKENINHNMISNNINRGYYRK